MRGGAAGDRPPYATGFATLGRELTGEVLRVDAGVPAWLTGSLIRTGPARFEVGGRSYEHWFDGLAMLHRFAFADGRVTYSNRYLRSKAYCEAMARGRITRSEFMTDPCRTLFGRVMNLFRTELTDNANVNVATLDDEIVALTETPLPVRFDPETLETLGVLDYGLSVGGQLSTAHPHYDGRRCFSYIVMFGRRSTYRLFVDEGGRRKVLAELPADRPAYMHSFGMSQRYLVLAEFPFRVNPLRLKFSGKPFIRNYRWEPEAGLRFTVIEKASGAVAARAKGAPCFAFHHVNAHEVDGAVMVDLAAFPDPDIIERLRLARLRSGEPIEAVARLRRYRVPLGNGAAREARASDEPLSDAPIELPRIDYARRAGQPLRCVWGVGLTRPGDFIDNITKIELSTEPGVSGRHVTWHQPGCYPGEPVFVPRPGGVEEDDGVLLSVVFDSSTERSFLLVLDAATLDERARAFVPHAIPFGFHGNHFPGV
ncbi:carotenoid oxygenase family protein [Inquilinus limosus]|uniref:carotenoid oxygenase family protein n=1 Tax=Inquilinus limosus TaxID=171674 RepID=UPI003F5CF83B